MTKQHQRKPEQSKQPAQPEQQCDAWHPDRRLRCARQLGHIGQHLASFETWPESAAIHYDDGMEPGRASR